MRRYEATSLSQALALGRAAERLDAYVSSGDDTENAQMMYVIDRA